MTTRVTFYMVNDTPIVEVFDDTATLSDLQHLAEAVGCVMYTPEIAEASHD